MRNHFLLTAQATVASFALGVLVAQAAESPPPQICNTEGSFGIRFGGTTSSTQIPRERAFFGRNCYQVDPPVRHPHFDTYVACVSEFDGKIFLIQALKILDIGSDLSATPLTPSQVQSNRRLGKQIVDSLLAQVRPEGKVIERVDDASRKWETYVETGISLEVTNFPNWAVTIDCVNEAMTKEVFRHRLQRDRQ